MVVDSDTVVDPQAVVVKPVDASVAVVAVSTLHRSQHLTSRAEVTGFEELVELKEAQSFGLLNVARVFEAGDQEEDNLSIEQHLNHVEARPAGVERKHELREAKERQGIHDEVTDLIEGTFL